MDGGYIFGNIPSDCVGITVLMQKITTIAPLTFDCSKTLAKTSTKADLAKQPWIMMGANCPFDHFLIKQLGEDIPAVLKTADDGTRLELVKSGLGLSFIELEEALKAQENQIVNVIPSLDFSTPLRFVVARNKADDPVIKTLLNKVKKLWN